MEYQIYIDVVFVVNFVMDYILLGLTGKLLQYERKWYRLFLAALAGSCFTCILYVIPPSSPMVYLVIAYVGITFLMVFIGFPKLTMRLVIKGVVLLYFVACTLGGLLHFLYYDSNFFYDLKKFFHNSKLKDIGMFYFVILTACGFFILKLFLHIILQVKEKNTNLLEVILWINGKEITTKGLLDTGNHLKEPMTGKPVMVCEYQLIEPYVSEQHKCIIEEYVKEGTVNLEQMIKENIKDIRLIPFRSLGKEQGTMIGMIVEKVTLKSETVQRTLHHVVVSISEIPVSIKGEYSVILHPDFLK